MNTTLEGGAEGGRSTQVLTGLGEVAWANWVLTAVALVLLGAAVFGPMLGDFFWNDDLIWIDAARHTSLATLLPTAFLPSHGELPYRPATFLLFNALVPLCGCEPTGYRAAGLALHVVNGLLVYTLGRKLVGDSRLALAATLFWFVYPAHRWAVLWISDLAGLLFTAFAVSSLLIFWRYLAIVRVGRSAGRYYTLALAVFTLALLSKESAITLALLFPALEWMTQRQGDLRGRPGRAWLKYVPFFVLAVLYVAMGAISHQQRPGAQGYAFLSIHSVESVSKALIFLVDPFIPYNALNTMSLSRVLLLAGAVAAIWGVFVWRWGRREGWFLSAWVAFTIAPILIAAIFLVPFRGRYLYIVSIGYILLLAWLVRSVIRRLSPVIRRSLPAVRPLAAGALAVALVGLGTFNASQQSIIRDDPINALRRWTWGGIMGCPATDAMRARERSWEEADYRRAAQGFDQLELQIQPNPIDKLSRGLAYELAGDPARAAADYQAGLALVPAGGFDSRDATSGYYIPYERVAAYVQTRLDALGR